MNNLHMINTQFIMRKYLKGRHCDHKSVTETTFESRLIHSLRVRASPSMTFSVSWTMMMMSFNQSLGAAVG